jgi:hypothetical protein
MHAPLDLNTVDPDYDQWKVAMFHQNEATLLRQKADNVLAQIGHYERLFGPESDWVKGARLLAQFYQEMAQEQDRLADLHLEIAQRRGRR